MSAQSPGRNQLADRLWLPGVIAIYLVAVTIINPLREYAFSDDWAYALTVRHLVSTGIYQLNDFLGPNVPFQAYWGALFSTVFGYSLATLHASTVVLMIGGLAAMYVLAREHNLSPAVAAILALVMAASPLALEFSVTFMTDGQFMSLVTIALALYTRGFRLKSIPLIAAGSLAAACAIMVRQFGVAVIPGLAMMWWFGRDRKAMAPRVAIALAAPLIAGLYQASAGLVSPNWSGHWMGKVEMSYLAQPLTTLPETLWRVMVTADYLAFFCLPLIVPAAIMFYHDLQRTQRISKDSPSYRINVALLFSLPIAILGIAALGTLALDKPGVMPLIPWNLDHIATWPTPLISLLTLVVVCGAFLFVRLVVLRYAAPDSTLIPPHERLLDTTTLWLFVLQLALFQFGDEYLLHLLPFALIVFGRGLPARIERIGPALAGSALAMLVISTIWARGAIDTIETQWRLASRLEAQGVSSADIYTNSWEWNSYQGAFDDYLRSINYADGTQRQYSPYFNEWLPARYKAARYVIGPLKGDEDLSGWEVVETLEYQDSQLQTQTMYALRRK